MRIKLQYKIATQVFFVGLVLLLIGIGIHNKFTVETAQQEVLNRLEALSQELAFSIDAILREKASKVQAFASSPIIENLLLESNSNMGSLPTEARNKHINALNDRWMKEEDPNSPFIQSYMHNPVAAFLKKQLLMNPEEYGEIFLTNRFGALVATTGKLTTLAHGHKYWWKNSFNQERGRIFFDDRGYDDSVGGCVLGVVVPIKKNNQIIGILKSNILIQRVLSKVVENKQINLQQNEVYFQAHMQRAIVRKGGKIVTQPGIEPLSADVPVPIKSLLSNQRKGALRTSIDTIPTFAAFSQVPITNGNEMYGFGGSPKSIDHAGGNDNEDWNIVISEPTAQAMKLFNRNSQFFYLTTFLLTTLLALFALFIGRWITRPVNALIAATQEISHGNYSVSMASPSKNDELSEVICSFNNMASNLEESRQKLEQEQKRRLTIEKELQQKRKMEAVGSLAGGIAHNFNNNLAIILGNIELAAMKISHPENAISYLDVAKTAICRSRDLIRQIMIYSHQENYENKPFKMGDTIKETLKFLESTIPTTVTIRTRVSAATNELTIYGDKVQIQQSLLNLCTNAVHAMSERGTLEIGLDTFAIDPQSVATRYQAKPGTYLALSVSDNGCGMDKDVIEKIFDPFFTTKEVGKGTGMGLATVRGIISQHQGFIDVQSTVGHGTTITLYLPAQQELVVTEEEEKKLLPGNRENILFVDDDEDLNNIACSMLESINYQVTGHTSAKNALGVFRQQPEAFDLVITDQIMPEITGKELILAIKQIRDDIPVILCTGHDTQITATELETLGISDFCLKPLEIKELAAIIRACLTAKPKTSN